MWFWLPLDQSAARMPVNWAPVMLFLPSRIYRRKIVIRKHSAGLLSSKIINSMASCAIAHCAGHVSWLTRQKLSSCCVLPSCSALVLIHREKWFPKDRSQCAGRKLFCCTVSAPVTSADFVENTELLFCSVILLTIYKEKDMDNSIMGQNIKFCCTVSSRRSMCQSQPLIKIALQLFCTPFYRSRFGYVSC